MSSLSSPRVLLVGGGHAMLPSILAARQWAAAGAQVTLLNDHPYLYYSGMVPEWLGGVYEREAIRIDLAAMCAQSSISFLQASVAGLHPAERNITTDAGENVPYDLIAFDIGSRNPGDAGDAVPSKPLHCIEKLANQLDDLFREPPRPFRLVIVGGGAAGVEIALNISARFQQYGRSSALSLALIESSPNILPDFPEALGCYTAALLTERGATLHTQTNVEDVAGGVKLRSGKVMDADAVLWTTGSVGSSLFMKAGLPCDERNFVHVSPSLQSITTPRLFAAGDCCLVQGHADLRRIGVHAVKQGLVLRDNLTVVIRAVCQQKEPARDTMISFKPYPISPLILSTGTQKGIWQAGSLWMAAKTVLRLKHFVDRRWMRTYSSFWSNGSFRNLIDAAAPLP